MPRRRSKPGGNTEPFARQRLIGLRPILRETVGIIEIIRLQIGLQNAIEFRDNSLNDQLRPRAGIKDAAGLGLASQPDWFRQHRRCRRSRASVAGAEDSRALSGAHLHREADGSCSPAFLCVLRPGRRRAIPQADA